MMALKKFNGIIYLIVLVGLVLKLIDDTMKTKLFTFISATTYWNFAYWIFLVFFILSCVSLFKKELIFKYVPYAFYIVFVIVIIALFIVNSKEDL
jgi:amino acid permease